MGVTKRWLRGDGSVIERELSGESDQVADLNQPGANQKSGRVVGRILPAAVRLWLKSQADQIEALSIDLSGRDRDLLSGYIPGVVLDAEKTIYRGIHIGNLHLSAKDIRINNFINL